MTANFKLVIEYDGTQYHGWQRQPTDKSIQGEIEAALYTMTRQKITIIGSGRTDSGVHALGQTGNFKCKTRISPKEFQNGLNSLLPSDIVIRGCEYAAPEFHARFDTKSKVYRYSILNSAQPSAIGRQYHWWLHAPLDVNAMQTATRYLPGKQDFRAFEGTGSPRASTVRHVMAAYLKCEVPHQLEFYIQADGFLRFMVRNIIGTLVDVGRRKISPDQLTTIIESRDRNLAGATAPPQGLCLLQVNY